MMQQQPLSPAPDVDQALLVRMAMDMDWPPRPATDAFLEMAVERLLDEPDPAPPPRTADAPFVSARPLPPRRAHKPNAAARATGAGATAGCCMTTAYEPKPGTRTAAVLAYLRDRKAPATASEIAAGAAVPRHYVGGLAAHLISKGAVRRIEQSDRTHYEAV